MTVDLIDSIETVAHRIHDVDQSIELYSKSGLDAPADLAAQSRALHQKLKDLQALRNSLWNDASEPEIKLWKSVIDMSFKDIFSRPKTTLIASCERRISHIYQLSPQLTDWTLSRNRRNQIRTEIRKIKREFAEERNSNVMTAFDFLMGPDSDELLSKIGIDVDNMRETIRRKMTSGPTIKWRNARINYGHYMKLVEMEELL